MQASIPQPQSLLVHVHLWCCPGMEGARGQLWQSGTTSIMSTRTRTRTWTRSSARAGSPHLPAQTDQGAGNAAGRGVHSARGRAAQHQALLAAVYAAFQSCCYQQLILYG